MLVSTAARGLPRSSRITKTAFGDPRAASQSTKDLALARGSGRLPQQGASLLTASHPAPSESPWRCLGIDKRFGLRSDSASAATRSVPARCPGPRLSRILGRETVRDPGAASFRLFFRSPEREIDVQSALALFSRSGAQRMPAGTGSDLSCCDVIQNRERYPTIRSVCCCGRRREITRALVEIVPMVALETRSL